jgi:hypothetical protein
VARFRGRPQGRRPNAVQPAARGLHKRRSAHGREQDGPNAAISARDFRLFEHKLCIYSSAYATVLSKALAFCRESSLVCCTTMGTSDSIMLA